MAWAEKRTPQAMLCLASPAQRTICLYWTQRSRAIPWPNPVGRLRGLYVHYPIVALPLAWNPFTTLRNTPLALAPAPARRPT